MKENLYFTHSKIITSCVYITSINIKWVKFKYINEDSCLLNCTTFYIKLLEKCINNINSVKDSIYTFDEDFQEIILKRRLLSVEIYNTNDTQQLYLDINDYLNFIISKGIKLIGSYKDYLNFFGIDKTNMDNLVHQSYEYFASNIKGFSGKEKLCRINEKFKNNYYNRNYSLYYSIRNFFIFYFSF